ncbi:MAG: rhodanese-like domain-containing protein [Bacteroidetes bacterium]|nr:rhodanese-like domain-containing protein [Bacteroidota bacterium]
MKNKLQADKSSTIIDVRDEWEFAGGHVAGSINIPLHEIPARLDEFKSIHNTIVLCCASGNRSRQATMYLTQQGLTNVQDGGSWLTVNELIS